MLLPLLKDVVILLLVVVLVVVVAVVVVVIAVDVGAAAVGHQWGEAAQAHSTSNKPPQTRRWRMTAKSSTWLCI